MCRVFAAGTEAVRVLRIQHRADDARSRNSVFKADTWGSTLDPNPHTLSLVICCSSAEKGTTYVDNAHSRMLRANCSIAEGS